MQAASQLQNEGQGETEIKGAEHSKGDDEEAHVLDELTPDIEGQYFWSSGYIWKVCRVVAKHIDRNGIINFLPIVECGYYNCQIHVDVYCDVTDYEKWTEYILNDAYEISSPSKKIKRKDHKCLLTLIIINVETYFSV